MLKMLSLTNLLSGCTLFATVSFTSSKQAIAIAADLKKDKEGKKECETYLKQVEIKKAELQARIDANKAWIAKFEANKDNGAFEQQYKRLLTDIQTIYDGAKEFHGKGIDMLIKEFDYHLSYKRWNDTFTAVPFKPK